MKRKHTAPYKAWGNISSAKEIVKSNEINVNAEDVHPYVLDAKAVADAISTKLKPLGLIQNNSLHNKNKIAPNIRKDIINTQNKDCNCSRNLLNQEEQNKLIKTLIIVISIMAFVCLLSCLVSSLLSAHAAKSIKHISEAMKILNVAHK